MQRVEGDNSERPIGVDLFAGAGGLSLGFEQAGFDVVAAVEIDPIHSAVHKFNFPQTRVLPHSVEHLRADAIRDAAGIGNRDVDCLFGGAPCQGFSMIGHRALDDPRNRLVLEFVRLVHELQPRTFVFENVKGLTIGRHRNFLEELVTAFDRIGYRVRLPWKVLNAGHFGTPQFRERLILLGARSGERLPAYPDPTSNIAGRRKDFPQLGFGPNCADAIGDLPDAEQFPELLKVDSVYTTGHRASSPYAAELRCLANDAWHFGYVRDWDRRILTSSARTNHTEISQRRFADTPPGDTEPISRFYKLSANGASNTLRAGTDGARGAFTSPRPIHYALARCVTVREMARLHGFPDWFRLHVTKWHGARQIGNAVPPPLARAVASAVSEAIGGSRARPERILAFGDQELLCFDLTQAAKHFEVNRPASRRDRKSGAKKRKQVDIERERLLGTVNG